MPITHSRTTRKADRALIARLADAEVGHPAALDAWLAVTPEADATQALFHIASVALPWHRLVRKVWLQPLLIWLILASNALFVYRMIWLLFDPVASGVGKVIGWSYVAVYFLAVCVMLVIGRQRWTLWQHQRGRSAVLLLAERRDPRALPILLEECEATPRADRREWNACIMALLTRYLDETEPSRVVGEGAEYQQQRLLRHLATTLLLPTNFVERDDLTDAQTDFALTLVRYLHKAHDLENRALVKSRRRADQSEPTKPKPSARSRRSTARIRQAHHCNKQRCLGTRPSPALVYRISHTSPASLIIAPTGLETP